MKRVALLTSISVLVLGCTTTHQSVEPNHIVKQQSTTELKNNIEPKTNTVQTDTAVEMKPICSSPQDIKYRVFHSMYSDEQIAEKAYLKITANTSVPQFFQLMATARKESIDIDTRDKGGDLGFIKIANFDKSFGTAVSHLPLKKLSHPIQSKFGWHLVWVSDALDIKTNQHCR